MRRRRIELYKTGGVDSLRLIEDEAPSPAADEVRIAVKAAGVAFADVMMRHGKYPGAPKLPFTPGYDVMGTIDAIGESVDGVEVGQSVVAIPQFGGYTDSLCVPATRAVAVPSDTPPADAVCLVLNYLSAYQMLHHTVRLESGARILVHSGAGGVGTALLQLGRDLGLTMYATASRGKHNVVEASGGTPIDYRQEDFVQRIQTLEPQGLDAVFDPIGPDNWLRSRTCLRKGGHLVAYGMLASFDGDRPRGSFLRVLLRALALKVFRKGRRFSFFSVNFSRDERAFAADLEAVIALYRRGVIAPVIGAVLPLSAAAEAHQLLTDGAVAGKVVLSG